MPTQPPSDLYDPDYAVAAVQVVVDQACPALREVVSYGSAVLARCLGEASHRGEGEPLDEHIAVFFLFHRLLESLDATTELIRLGRITSTRPLLRSSFEALLSIEYILQEQTKRRAFAFLVAQMKDRMRECDLQTSGTPTRIALERAAMIENRTNMFPIDPAAAVRRDSLENMLTKPNWKEAAAAWQVAKAVQRRRPAWHSLYDGPRTLEQLAESVGRPYSYAILYRPYAETAHVADLPRVFSAGGGQVRFGCIPDWRNPETAASMACVFGVISSRQVLMHYRPSEGEDHARWYVQNVKPVFDAISEMNLDG